MSKRKLAIIGGASILAIGLAGVGTWLWYKHHRPPLSIPAVNDVGSTSGTVLAQNDIKGIPLTEAQPADDNTGGLSVSSGSSTDGLGQLTPSSGGASTDQGGGGQTAQKSPFDPSTFPQYDKYKDGNAALFADVVPGEGDELTAGKKAAVFYKGWLTDGTLFDQSHKDDKGELQPFVFTLGQHQVIPGWEEALTGMKVGGVRLVIVPPSAGYGASGQGPIPGNSVLIFQVQLAAVQ